MSDLTLSEERLNELLRCFQQVIDRPNPSRNPEGACLGLEQIRRLVLAPAPAAAGSEQHLEQCRKCARLYDQMAAVMPHFPLRVLLAAEQGLLSQAEMRAVERHAAPDGCDWCRERSRVLHAVHDRIAEWREPLPLPHPGALAAGIRGLNAVATSEDATLQVEFVEEGPHLVLEFRTRDSRLDHHLVGYLMYGRQRRTLVEGFAVLRPDVDGWFTGCASFGKGDLYSRLSGCCERIVVSPVDVTLVSFADRAPLLASAAALPDQASRRAWMQWVGDAQRRLLSEPIVARIPSTPHRQFDGLLTELGGSLESGTPPRI